MDADRFDRLSRAISHDVPRRTLTALLNGLAVSNSLGSLGIECVTQRPPRRSANGRTAL